MKIITDIFKMSSRRIRQTPATSIFFVIGMTFSMLIVSVGISFVAENLKAQQVKEDAMPPNSEQFNLYRPLETQPFGYKTIPKFLKGLEPDTGLIFNHLMMHVDESQANTFCPVSAEWFSGGAAWHYPVVEGRCYTAEEVEKGAKVVMLGETLQKYCYMKDGKRYIDIERETYEVIGRVGLPDQGSLWDNRIFMPFTALPEISKADYDTYLEIDFILYNPRGAVADEGQKILENAKALFPDVEIECYGGIQVDDVIENVKNSQNPIFSIAFLGYVVALIYGINIVVFWMEKRRYEIGVRKAFGYTNRAVAQLIFSEMMGLSLLSFILSILIQGGVRAIVGKVSGYILKLYLPNILLGLALVLLTTFLISLWPVIRVLKIQPAEALKGGGGINA